MKIKKLQIIAVLVTFLILGISIPQSMAQLEDAIEQLTGSNTKGYLTPFVEVFGRNLNTGIYRTAHVSKMGLHLYVGIATMGALIPESAKSFNGIPPEPYNQTPVKTASVFGGEGTVVPGPVPSLSYAFQNGQIQGNLFPLAVPQLEIGSILGTVIKVRFFLYDFGEGIGEIKLNGYGFQHSLSQYVPLMPIDISLGLFHHSFEVGDIITAGALSYGLQASKSFSLLTFYGTLAVEKADMDVSYTYEGEGSNQSEEIELKLKSKNSIYMTLGAGLNLPVVKLNGDLSLGKYTTVSLGIGFGI